MTPKLSRRKLLHGVGGALSVTLLERSGFALKSPPAIQASPAPEAPPAPDSLKEFPYSQIKLQGPVQIAQRENVLAVLMGLRPDSLLKPFRAMADQPDPGPGLGGWYDFKPDYDFHHDDTGFAPGHALGQWTSALSRFHASSQFDSPAGNSGRQDKSDMENRVVHLHTLLAKSVTPAFFAKTRFPAYTFDKLCCGLLDAHRLLGDRTALATLDKVAAAAAASLPGHAIDRDVQWKLGADASWMWDESYTLPENLYLLSAAGASPRYRRMGEDYLLDATYFEPLSRGVNVLSDKHAYSYVNALCSAMQAYLIGGSTMHLDAAKNGFAMLERQSLATGGWGPDELLRKPGHDDLARNLDRSHNSFETPCGSYAHMKLTRYLLRATRDGRYGDSMERVMLNTVLGALPLEPDGRAFYYADYNVAAKRTYSPHRWPCCSGTLPQVVADYGINSYLHDEAGVWINLYQPSDLRWTTGQNSFELFQTGTYLEDGSVRLAVNTPHPAPFTLRLRIPAWSGPQATLLLNGETVPIVTKSGFTAIERTWHGGDVVELNLKPTLRLEPIPANGGPDHPGTVALLWGPLVLFALRQPGEIGPLSFGQNALLGAERIGPAEWAVKTATGLRRMVPFTAVGDHEYSTYLTAT